MSGRKGQYQPPHISWKDLQKHYDDFVNYRHEIAMIGCGTHRRTADHAYEKEPVGKGLQELRRIK